MSKIRRNDPCPCGSGKKYKNCCLHANNMVTDPKQINDELNRLHQEFHSFAVNNYEQEIREQTERFDQPVLQDHTETVDVYQTGLSIWILLNLPFMRNDRTLFDIFYANNQLALSRRMRSILSVWRDQTPSVYEIISANRRRNRFVTLKEIHTEKTFSIPFYEGENFVEGTMLIGTLLPFMGYHSFLITYMKLYKHDKQELHRLLAQYEAKDGGLATHFPQFLAEALIFSAEEPPEWDSELYEEVMQLFAAKMVERNYPDQWILKGFDLWKQYCEAESPGFKNATAQAAALEYVVRQKLRGEPGITQAQLARIYGASAGTVSSGCRRLTTALAES